MGGVPCYHYLHLPPLFLQNNTHIYQAPLELVQEVARTGRLPVVNFAAGGVATPADAALMMQLGMDGVFVGSGIFKSTDPVKRARAIVQAVTHFKNPKVGRWVVRELGGVSWVGGWLCRLIDETAGDRSHKTCKTTPPNPHSSLLPHKQKQLLAEVSTNLGAPMVGISDIKGDAVNFRDREGGEEAEARIPPKKQLHGATEVQLYGSSWNVH